MKYTLKCKFCNKEVGELDLPEGQVFDPQMFADIRCSDCEQKYGSYHDIVVEVEQKLRNFIKDTEVLKDEIKKHIEKGGYKKDAILSSVNAFVEKAKKDMQKNNKQDLLETQSGNNQ